MYLNNKWSLHVALFLLNFYHNVNAKPKSEIPSDWKTYINDEMVDKYLGKDADDMFTDGLFEGDISDIQSDSQENPASIAKNVISDSSFRWPEGIMPTLISAMFRPSENKMIVRAMKSINALTHGAVRLVERTDEKDYVEFIRAYGCFSPVGRQSGKQQISLSRGCLEELGQIQHEIMHALGFYHEMSRSDRDDFVWINWENIQKDDFRQFQKYINGKTFGLSYDYESVLHYPFTAFAIDNQQPTIVPKQKNARIGQNKNLSPGDIKKIQAAYKIPVEISSLAQKTTSAQTFASTPANTALQRSLVLPFFRMDDVTMSECFSLDSQNCGLSINSENCTKKYFNLYCNKLASNSEMRLALEKMERMNRDRPISIQMSEQRSLTQQLLAPVARNILWLEIGTYENWTSGMLKNLDLSNLIDLWIYNCTNVRINNGDLDSFPQLRRIGFNNTSIVEIEKGSFDALPGLKMLVLEFKLLLQSQRSIFREQIWLFHCSCEYVWLRDLFRRRPLLLKARQWGEISNVGGLGNIALTKSEIFVPVDCAKGDLIGSAEQESFSINDDCSRSHRINPDITSLVSSHA